MISKVFLVFYGPSLSNIVHLKSKVREEKTKGIWKYDIIFCSETLVSSRRNVSEVLLSGFNKSPFYY